MAQFISLLRGINVGKSKRISKDALIDLYSSLGFKDIEVLIQSGNVVFGTSASSTKSIALRISEAFHRELSYDVPTVVLKSSELKKILKQNPFQKEAKEDPSKVLIGFFESKPDAKNIRSVNSLKTPPNAFRVHDSAMFVFCPAGVGRAKLPNFEKELGIAITFRNARVSDDILALATANS